MDVTGWCCLLLLEEESFINTTFVPYLCRMIVFDHVGKYLIPPRISLILELVCSYIYYTNYITVITR